MGAHTNSRQRRSAAPQTLPRRTARHQARQRCPAWRAAEPPNGGGAARRGATDCCCPSAKRPVTAAGRRCYPGAARAARRSRPAARSRVRRGRTRRPAYVEPTSGTVPRHTQSLGDAAQQLRVHVRLRGAVAQRDMRLAREEDGAPILAVPWKLQFSTPSSARALREKHEAERLAGEHELEARAGAAMRAVGAMQPPM